MNEPKRKRKPSLKLCSTLLSFPTDPRTGLDFGRTLGSSTIDFRTTCIVVLEKVAICEAAGNVKAKKSE